MSAARRTNDAPESITLKYNLFDLPTAQHKAGLAGFLIFLRGMNPPISPVELGSSYATIALTRGELQRVVDELYDTQQIEISSRTKFPKRTAAGALVEVEPKRVEEVETLRGGKLKKEKRFIYDRIQPKGAFLARWLQDGVKSAWLKLWQDMLWNTFRAIPATRGVYEERANGAPSSEGQRIWNALLSSSEARRKGAIRTEAIASSLFIGAQDVNAEKVPFQGLPEHNLLLNFSLVASLSFVAEAFDAKGKAEGRGFVIAVPEVADLELFTHDFVEMLQRLDPTAKGLYPRDARIVVPAEAGLELLDHFAYDRIRRQQVARRIAAVEVFHLQKQGNTVRIHSTDRVLPDPRILSEYEVLRGAFRNPFFRSLRLRNLLGGYAWHRGALNLMGNLSFEHFVHTENTPRLPLFGTDAARQFAMISDQGLRGGTTMSDANRDDRLAGRIYRLVGTYVHAKTEQRSGKTYDSFKNNKQEQEVGGKKVLRILYPRQYREANEKVCTDAFLAVRGRRDSAFVEYFSGTICSVPQVLREDEYLAITDALLRDPERVKTLTLLALSAHSALGGATEGDTAEEKQDEEEGGAA